MGEPGGQRWTPCPPWGPGPVASQSMLGSKAHLPGQTHGAVSEAHLPDRPMAQAPRPNCPGSPMAQSAVRTGWLQAFVNLPSQHGHPELGVCCPAWADRLTVARGLPEPCPPQRREACEAFLAPGQALPRPRKGGGPCPANRCQDKHTHVFPGAPATQPGGGAAQAPVAVEWAFVSSHVACL